MQKTYIGYARVSTEEQNEARQLESFRIFREPISQTLIDKRSGKMNDYRYYIVTMYLTDMILPVYFITAIRKM